VPLALLPDWVRPISWLLAPTWGMRAIRSAADGGSPWAEIGMCFLLGAGYVALGVFVTNRVLRAARARASLSLT
jgi:ABC-2 type transport system permease protein